MTARFGFVAVVFCFAPLISLRAGDVAPTDATGPVDSTPAPSEVKTTYDLDADAVYVGDARTNFGPGNKGDVSEESNSGRLVLGVQDNDGPIYRFGLAVQRYNFGLSKAAPLPNILQSENVVAGMDFQLFSSWLVRVEADPGFYNDGRATSFRDFNVPFTIGGSYIASETVQWVAGIEVDVNRQIPVFPAVGVHWSINDDWVLDMVLPTPRLEYNWSKELTMYVGANVDDGTYRIDRGFAAGTGNTRSEVVESEATHYRVIGYTIPLPHAPEPIYEVTHEKTYTTIPGKPGPNLKGAVVEYDEVRIGAGFSWKASKAFTLELEGGYLPYREYDFHRANTHFSNDNCGPYAQVSLNAQF